MNSYQKRMALANYEKYCTTDLKDLYFCYQKPSYAKIKAWEYCINKCKELNGTTVGVLSYNTFMFTAGFTYIDEDMHQHFVYITPSYDVDIIPAI